MKAFNERLAWLAGILDGEGYLSATLSKTNVARGRKKVKVGDLDGKRIIHERSLRFQVRVCATDASMILEIGSIADSLGLTYFVFDFKSKNLNAKPTHGIHFHGLARTDKLLRAVLPWLVTKRPQAELLLKM